MSECVRKLLHKSLTTTQLNQFVLPFQFLVKTTNLFVGIEHQPDIISVDYVLSNLTTTWTVGAKLINNIWTICQPYLPIKILDFDMKIEIVIKLKTAHSYVYYGCFLVLDEHQETNIQSQCIHYYDNFDIVCGFLREKVYE